MLTLEYLHQESGSCIDPISQALNLELGRARDTPLPYRLQPHQRHHRQDRPVMDAPHDPTSCKTRNLFHR
jgi:hypothetical protein